MQGSLLTGPAQGPAHTGRMLNILPTTLVPFLLAIVAAVAGFVFSTWRTGEAWALASKVLYAVAAGCVVIGIATWLLSH